MAEKLDNAVFIQHLGVFLNVFQTLENKSAGTNLESQHSGQTGLQREALFQKKKEKVLILNKWENIGLFREGGRFFYCNNI